MAKVYTIRIDLESQKGIADGLPKLLALFRKTNTKASFYLVMGGESNLFDVVKNRKKMKSAAMRTIKVFSFAEKLRMLLLPINFTRKNEKVLKEIIEDGHELGLHGFKHREWTRGLENINIKKRIIQMRQVYREMFGIEPKSFTAPGFNTNNNVIDELEKQGITHISDYDEEKYLGKIKNVPMTLKGEYNTPFIEYWVGQGKTDDQISDIFKERIKNRKIVSFYLHGLYEGRFKIKLLRRLIEILQEEGYTNKRVIDYK
jgi:peptidoglycan/xylan/chitin deacetylase (PgdA/CDA1 family)